MRHLPFNMLIVVVLASRCQIKGHLACPLGWGFCGVVGRHKDLDSPFLRIVGASERLVY